MDKRGTYWIVVMVLIALAVFALVWFQKSSLLDTNLTGSKREVASSSAWENAPAEIVITPKTVIAAKHAYVKGEHTIAGEVPLPTSCDVLTSSAIASPDKKQVLLQLNYKVASGENCAQSITPARFKVSVKANKDAVITTTLNGQSVTLNLIEAAAGENLDDFELYFKG